MQGETADNFFILLEGEAEATQMQPGATDPTVLMRYGV